MNRQFWIALAGSIGGMLLGIWAIKPAWLIRGLIKPLSLYMMATLQRIGWRDFLETNLRAAHGQPIPRPFGTPLRFFRLDRFQFNPVYLSRKPLNHGIPVHTEVVLGPMANKPLILQTPLMLGGMSHGGSLSYPARAALDLGASLAGTATNTGSGPFIEELRQKSAKYAIQFARGFWSRSPDILRRVDMIEIALGHGAWGPSPVRIDGKQVTDGFARRIGAIPGLDVLLESRLPEVETGDDWKALIARLKDVSGGVPIAVKIGGTHYLERELELLIEGGVDVIVIDGAEGGTHACPVILLDDLGLPTLPCLCRAVKFFEDRRLKGKVSLVMGGGLVTPGDYLKCMALGVDAVIIGTVACLAISHTQVAKALPFEPPTEIIYYEAKKAARYNPVLGAKHLANYLQSCLEEMKQVARSLGKSDLREIGKQDLVALDKLYGEMAGVREG